MFHSQRDHDSFCCVVGMYGLALLRTKDIPRLEGCCVTNSVMANNNVDTDSVGTYAVWAIALDKALVGDSCY